MSSQVAHTELTLEEYLAIVRRRWVWLVVPVALFAGLATLLGLRADPQYTATASVLLADSAAQEALDPASTNTGLLTRRIENEINFAQSDETERLIADRLGFLPSDHVVISGVDSADVLEFTSTAVTPDDAALWANTWAEAYVETKQVSAETSITNAVGQLEDRLAALQEQRQEIRAPLDELRDQVASARTEERKALLQTRVDRLADDLQPSVDIIDTKIAQLVNNIGDLQLGGEVARSGTASVLQAASPPEQESGAAPWKTSLIGLLAGLVFGVALALAAESFDKTFKSGAEVVAATGLPVLGSIPRPDQQSSSGELASAVANRPGSNVADGYQRVSSAFQFSLVGKNIKSVLITSANQSEGKTTTSANLAYSLAALDKRVALVDVDFRRPRLHKALGFPMEPGFSNHLIDGTPLEDLASYLDADHMLAMITCGGLPPNPAEFISMPEFGAALASLKEVADLVVLDGPPLLPVADSLALARHVDAVILTVFAGSTKKEHLAASVESVQQVGGNVLGIVMIGVKDDTLSGAYNYYGDADEETKRRRSWDRQKQVIRVAPAAAPKDSTPPTQAATPVADPMRAAIDTTAADVPGEIDHENPTPVATQSDGA